MPAGCRWDAGKHRRKAVGAGSGRLCAAMAGLVPVGRRNAGLIPAQPVGPTLIGGWRPWPVGCRSALAKSSGWPFNAGTWPRPACQRERGGMSADEAS